MRRFHKLRLWLLYRGKLRRDIVLMERKVKGVAWEIVARPKGKNRDNRNESGVIILLKHTDTGAEEEVHRVAYERSNSLNPDVSFQDQLDHEIEKARHTVEHLNELTAGAGELV